MPPQNPKRKRQSSSSTAMVPEDKHVLFTQWAENRGVEINGLEASQITGRGLGLMTIKKIKSGQRLLFIPEKAMFKPAKDVLQAASLPQASPQAQLAITAMVQFGSHFELWRNVLPTFEDFKESMPMLWSEDLRKHLPPAVNQPLDRQMADYRSDWTKINSSNQQFDEDKFKYWWLIVNSRSFYWKPPKGRGGVMVLCPFIDYMNHGSTDSTCRVTMTGKGYEVVANRDYDAGEEILATYGPHSNDKLLVHYGFILPHGQPGYSKANPNPDDEIRLDCAILPNLQPEARSQLQDVGFLGGYALIPSTNELCFKTQVAIRATLLTANEWEYFMQNGEDLGEDRSLHVEKRVEEMCKSYAEEAEENINALQKLPESMARDTLLERWQQICDAFYEFDRKIRIAENDEERKVG